MNKIFLFSIGMAAILTVSTMNFSIQTSMAFPQNSNQNMMMGQWPMMKQMNQTGMGPMMMGQGMMMPCIMMGPMMMGNQTMMAMMPCIDGNGSNDESNWYDGSNDDGSNDGNGSNDEPNWYDGSNDDGSNDGNGSNESNWYDGSNDDGSNDDGSNDGNGSNESNWYDGNATGNTEQIKINFFFYLNNICHCRFINNIILYFSHSLSQKYRLLLIHRNMQL